MLKIIQCCYPVCCRCHRQDCMPASLYALADTAMGSKTPRPAKSCLHSAYPAYFIWLLKCKSFLWLYQWCNWFTQLGMFAALAVSVLQRRHKPKVTSWKDVFGRAAGLQLLGFIGVCLCRQFSFFKERYKDFSHAVLWWSAAARRHRRHCSISSCACSAAAKSTRGLRNQPACFQRCMPALRDRALATTLCSEVFVRSSLHFAAPLRIHITAAQFSGDLPNNLHGDPGVLVVYAHLAHLLMTLFKSFELASAKRNPKATVWYILCKEE